MMETRSASRGRNDSNVALVFRAVLTSYGETEEYHHVGTPTLVRTVLMPFDSDIIAQIPTQIDLSQSWLVDYWSQVLGVTRNRLRQAVHSVGQSAKRVRSFVNNGVTIAVEGDDGTFRRAVKLMPMTDGVAVSVPYHPEKKGMVFEAPMIYDRTFGQVSLEGRKTYRVNDTVKLSMHLDGGFVQFSKGGKGAILSGYSEQLKQAKGVGLHNEGPIRISSGPVFGIMMWGLEHLPLIGPKKVERFRVADLWHHPRVDARTANAINIEVFMFPRSRLQETLLADERMTLTSELPFIGLLDRTFDLRVIEFPSKPWFLGVIVSRHESRWGSKSGYILAGPGCRLDNGEMIGPFAVYPRPDVFPTDDWPALDYKPG
jgi:hypothetical protein